MCSNAPMYQLDLTVVQTHVESSMLKLKVSQTSIRMPRPVVPTLKPEMHYERRGVLGDWLQLDEARTSSSRLILRCATKLLSFSSRTTRVACRS